MLVAHDFLIFTAYMYDNSMDFFFIVLIYILNYDDIKLFIITDKKAFTLEKIFFVFYNYLRII